MLLNISYLSCGSQTNSYNYMDANLSFINNARVLTSICGCIGNEMCVCVCVWVGVDVCQFFCMLSVGTSLLIKNGILSSENIELSQCI